MRPEGEAAVGDIDTTNVMLVVVQGEDIVLPSLGRKLDRITALNMAAWIVAVCDEGDFEPLLEAIRAT